MHIHCTKRACERLKISTPVATTEYNPLYSWRLNVVEEGHKRIVVFMHDTSRFCVVLDNIKAKDWPKLTNIFLKGFVKFCWLNKPTLTLLTAGDNIHTISCGHQERLWLVEK